MRALRFQPERAAIFRALVLAGALLGCSSPDREPATSFYDRRIGPILVQSCSKSPTQSGCHVAADNRGNALGNLNLESYQDLALRRDLLLPYGPYGLPALLVKSVAPFQIALTNWESSAPTVITTDVPHAGGTLLDTTSSSYTQIVQWIERGATENNTVAAKADVERTRCSNTVGADPGFDPAVDPPNPDYEQFQRRVIPVLRENCAAGNCHGSPANSLYVTCGDSDEEKRWNYFAVSGYVSTQADASEILRRALASSAGGVYHEGGDVFTSPSEAGYQALLEWAEARGGPDAPDDPGFRFFAERVQPMFVKKGCMLIGCHSPAMGHDYRLHGGSGGHFGLPATRRNYELTLDQIALESDDPDVSRIIRKNLVPAFDDPPPGSAPPRGITHRGGALFGFGRDDCDLEAARTGPLDEQPPYCVVRAWIELERAERMASAEPLSSVVYVRRPRRTLRDAPQDFEDYAPGADLIRAPATPTEDGSLTLGAGESLLSTCGLGSDVDIRRPSVSWDGRRIAFSARTSATTPWQVYVLEGASCAPDPVINAPAVDDSGAAVPDNGELVHNFDPVFAPDGRIVFTSTRGNVMNTGVFSYAGPQRTPADPSKLNANVYVAEEGRVRQLTFLLNQELTPSFMSDGRLIMVTEKRAPEFYQLAGRRQNLDGGDYHPLFGQRGTIGYNQFTDVVELADKNFAAILSDRGAQHGAGVLAVINRSVGIDQHSQNPDDYLQDHDAQSWQNPSFFQRALRMLDGVGRPGEGGRVYRNPSPLPNGNLLVSMAEVSDVGAFDGGFGLYVVNPVVPVRYGPIATDADDLLWPVAVYGRAVRRVFQSRLDEPTGATRISADESRRDRAEVLILDVPLLSSLLFQNTRSQRILPDPAGALEVWENLPPDVKSFAEGGEFVIADRYGEVYVRRRALGTVTPDAEDGSARIVVPGGMPITLATNAQLEGDRRPEKHFQREEMQFYPGEIIRQSFRRDLFNGVCGGCHGSVNGRESHVAVNPDILTQASAVRARSGTAEVLMTPRGDDRGPPFP